MSRAEQGDDPRLEFSRADVGWGRALVPDSQPGNRGGVHDPRVGQPGDGVIDEAVARRWLPGPGGNAALDRIAALAARLLGAQSAQVSLLTDIQTVAAGSGLPDGAIGSCGPLGDSLCTVTVAQGAPLVVADTRGDPRTNSLPPVTSGQVGAYLGVPLTSQAGGAVGALCVFDPLPHAWGDNDVSILTHLAESVRAELELFALTRDYDNSRTRFDLAVQAGDIGSFDRDLVTGELEWDDRLITMFGYDAGEERFERNIDSLNRRVHPDDAQSVAQAVAKCIAEVGPLLLHYRIVLPDGRERWLQARGRALAGPDGRATRLLGVALDITEHREAQRRAEHVLSSMSVGYLSMSSQWDITYVNAEGRRLLQAVGPDDLVGKNLWEAFPSAVGSKFGDAYVRVAETGIEERLEAYYAAPLNARLEVRIVPEIDGIGLYFLDITERHETQQLLQLSVDVSEHMVGAVSIDAAVGALARLVVPALADWTIVTLIDTDGQARDVQSWHVSEVMRPAVARYSATRLEGGGSGAIAHAIRRHKPVVIPADVVDLGYDRLNSDIAKAALLELAPASAVAVPMVAGGEVRGALTLCRGPKRPAMAEHELAVVVSLCRRAALAVDNARLYTAQAAAAAHDRTVAEALQEVLLTQLPEPDHLHLAARYLTAADGDQVGGDWYDAIIDADGATTLMIGDVVGHDIRAAAVMGQLRTMLRMLALQRHDSPAVIMRNLDYAARDLRLHTMASVVTAQIEQTEDERREGNRTLRWSNAGHPPPILLLPDGTTEILRAERADILIGVAPEYDRVDHVRSLPADSTVLFYTDGLVETRDADIDDGITRLRGVLSRNHTLPLDDLLDVVLEENVGAQPDDDVAVLAVRLNREDRPRPPDAGPAHL